MAVSIDTVYQRVLSVANKEQRGYVTPQEFNLFANQAQMDIFEQYFYDLNQFSRLKGNNLEYADMVTILEEKISVFKKRHQPITISGSVGDGTLPVDVYRLGTVLRFSLNNVTGSSAAIIESVTEDDRINFYRSPLATPTVKRPVYVRTSSSGIKIYPNSTAAVTQTGQTNGTNTISVNAGGNINFIEVGQVVTGQDIPNNTTVTSINTTTGALGISNASTGSTNPVTLTFLSNDIKCNYVKKPVDASWNYTEINGVAMYNSTNSVDFELHASEETELVFKILQLAGISIESMELYQVAAQEEVRNIQQEKQ